MSEIKDLNLIKNFIKKLKSRKDKSMMDLSFLKLNLLNKEFLDIETEKKKQLINSETKRLLNNSNENSSFLNEIRLRLNQKKKIEKIKKKLLSNDYHVKKKVNKKLNIFNHYNSSISIFKNYMLNNVKLNEDKIRICLSKRKNENLQKSLSDIKTPSQIFIKRYQCKSNSKKKKKNYSLHTSFRDTCNSERNKKIDKILKKTSKEGFKLEFGINKLIDDKKNNSENKKQNLNNSFYKNKVKILLKKYAKKEKENFSELNELEEENNTNKIMKYVKNNRTGDFILMKEGKADLVNFVDTFSKLDDSLFYNYRKPILSKYPQLRLKANIRVIHDDESVNLLPKKFHRNTNKIISLFHKNKRLYNSVESHLDSIIEQY